MLHGRFTQNRVPGAISITAAGMRRGQGAVTTRSRRTSVGRVFKRVLSYTLWRRGPLSVVGVRFRL